MSSTDDKKRRGKKESTNTVKKETNVNKDSLREQVDRAQAAVLSSKTQTEILHLQWRTHLLRMSYLLLLVSLHQSQGPIRACLEDIKSVNLQLDETDRIGGAQAMVLVLYDSVVQALGLIMAVALAYFCGLEDPHGDFGSQPFMLAIACIPPILSLHFQHATSVGCVDDEIMEQAGVQPAERLHGFPVVLVYFCIVSACYWFMDMQMKQHSKNVASVAQLRKDLLQNKDEKKK